MAPDSCPVRPVTHWTCARINATRWAVFGAVFGVVATAVRAWHAR